MDECHATSRRLALVLIAGLLLAQTACWPGVARLPDSSGFYYTGGKDNTKLFFFDIATKTPRVVVAAVRKDSKEITIARPDKAGPDSVTFRLAFYDPKGKELRVSRDSSFQFPKENCGGGEQQGGGGEQQCGGAELAGGVQLFWAPASDKILVSCFIWLAIYDVKADRFETLDNVVLAHFDGSPLLPDGSGFLAIKLRNESDNPSTATLRSPNPRCRPNW